MFRQLVTSWVRRDQEADLRCPDCGAIIGAGPSTYFMAAPSVSRLLPADHTSYEIIAWAKHERVVYYQMAGLPSGHWLLVTQSDHRYRVYAGLFGNCAGCDWLMNAQRAGSIQSLAAAHFEPLVELPAEAVVLLADSGFARIMARVPGGGGNLDLAWAGAETRAGVIWLEGMTPSVDDIVSVRNAEIRHQLLVRLGYEAFLSSARSQVIDRRGQEMLISVNDLFFARVICPTTGNQYLLRVPPCRRLEDAIAWTFFKSAADYRPARET